MPALLTSASMDPNFWTAVSTIFEAIALSPMLPSTRDKWSDSMKVPDFLMLRELATTLYPRSTNDWTMPAPMPCEAPVTMAVFCLLAIHQPPWPLHKMQVMLANYTHAELIPRREPPY